MIKIFFCIVLFALIFGTADNAKKPDYLLPEAVITELSRLDEAYHLLDQFSTSVWESWDDYMNFPFLFEFPNGLRVLIGHPAPPPMFVNYSSLTVHGRKVSIDTSNLNNFELKQPLLSGGGPIPFGIFENKPVTVVNIRSRTSISSARDQEIKNCSEKNILVYIHELMHCSQSKILKQQYGNLRINPDLNIATYGEIEGLALGRAYEQSRIEDAIPYMKDFCLARSRKLKGFSRQEQNSAAADEFREGEAVYSEVIILQKISGGFNSSLSIKKDTAYHRFSDMGSLLKNYTDNLLSSSGNTFDIYNKNYWYGCIESLLLQRYFPGWQKEAEAGKWLHQIFHEKLNTTGADSIASLQRFDDIYHIDELTAKHGSVISKRDQTFKSFQERHGMTYIIDTKPISLSPISYVNKEKQKYVLGLINMFPDGLGDISIDKITVSFKPGPAEINQLYYIKLIDTGADPGKKPYSIEFEKRDDSGYYLDATVTTPLFVLKGPEIEIIESSNRIKIVIHSRV